MPVRNGELMFANLKIGVRLALSFALVILLLCGITYVGNDGINTMNDAFDEVLENRVPKLELAAEFQTNAERIGLAQRDQLLATDKAELDKILERTDLLRKRNEEILDYFKQNVRTERGQERLRAMLDSHQEYAKLYEPMVALMRAGKIDEAKEWMREKMVPAREAMIKAAADDLAHERRSMEESAQHADNSFARAKKLMFSGTGFALVVAVLAAVWVTLSITRPISTAVNVATRMSEGDLTARVESKAKDETGLLLQAMGAMVEKLSGVVGEVRSSADTLASASEEMSATAQSMSQSSSEQASSVEETSASVEQMTASITQNTDNAKVTNQMASKSAQQANEGGEAVKKTVEAMKQIAQKISIIDDIAYQTNLLALNAAIEAARAGEHGKGFAVVAAEVRKLAERSQVAAQEIGEVASSSVDLAERAGTLLEEMVSAARRTSDLVQEIAAASQEQSSGVGQINIAMTQLSQLTQQNASASEELAATSEEMSAQAQQLQVAMSFFKTDHAGKPVRAPASVSKLAPRRPTLVKLDNAQPHSAPASEAAAVASKANDLDHNEVFEQQFVRF
jgi:methyl-accepting chemotaxis protein